MFPNARGITIHGGSFVHVEDSTYMRQGGLDEERRRKALKCLFNHVAPGALHNSEERDDSPRCHPHTRKSVQQLIMEWTRQPQNIRSLLWICGAAGAGKSAIMQTIAELCIEAGILGASFFFLRTSAKRNVKTHIIPSLAYQLAFTIPHFRDHLSDAIHSDPSIFTQNLTMQMRTLLINPMKLALAESPNPVRIYVILVDALDECAPEDSHSELLNLFAAVQSCPLRFVIASRPEYVIRETFALKYMQDRTAMLDLSDQIFKSDTDIQSFLVSKFDDIKSRHPMRYSIPDSWPPGDIVQNLVEKSSGQFIYPATVMKFIESPRHSPLTRLDIVLQAPTPRGASLPFAQLDSLYQEVFASVAHVSEILNIMWFIIHVGFIYASETIIETVMEYPQGELGVLLCDMHSLLHIPQDIGYECGSWPIRFHHASLQDFLLDPLRSRYLYTSPATSCAFLATCFIRHYDDLVPEHFQPQSYWSELATVLEKAAITEDLMSALYGLDVYRNISLDDFCSDSTSLLYGTSSQLIHGLDTFYGWLYRHTETRQTYTAAMSHIYVRLIGDLDIWLSQSITQDMKDVWSSNNWLFLLAYACRVYASITDVIRLVRYTEYAIDLNSNWEASQGGLLYALKVITRSSSRHTFQRLSGQDALNRVISSLAIFYLDNVPWIEASHPIAINFDSRISHWTRSLIYLIPRTMASTELGEKLVALGRRVSARKATKVEIHAPYIQPCSENEKCFGKHCVHMQMAILSLKREMYHLGKAVLDYLEGCKIEADIHPYNSLHLVCFTCQATNSFLNDNEYCSHAQFTHARTYSFFICD